MIHVCDYVHELCTCTYMTVHLFNTLLHDVYAQHTLDVCCLLKKVRLKSWLDSRRLLLVIIPSPLCYFPGSCKSQTCHSSS